VGPEKSDWAGLETEDSGRVGLSQRMD